MSSDPICKSSLLPFSAHDEDVLRILAMPVTDQMLQHVALKLTAAVGTPGHHHLPTPPVTPVRGRFALDNVTCAPEWDFPPLEKFLANLVLLSGIHTASVLCSMIYLKRVTRTLQSKSIKHGPETPYRLAAALFIIASKYNHDSSPSTAHWTVFVAGALGLDESACMDMMRFYEAWRLTKRGNKKGRDTEEDMESILSAKHLPTKPTALGMFGAEATVALEQDLLHLLDYDLRFSEDELRDCLNALSSHPRVVGPIQELQLGYGRPSREFVRQNREAYTMAMRRTASPMRATLGSTFTQGPLTPSSAPHTPLGLLKSGSRKTKLILELKTESVRYPNPWSCAPYPQLNQDMDVHYLSKLINGSNFRNPFPPLGVPAAPPSTPIAGIDSLPFIYGGKTQPSTPVSSKPVLPGMIAPPSEDSPWVYGQVGEILRNTMERQAKQLAAVAANPLRGPKLLDTPPPVSAFGSGTLYLRDSNRSSLEPMLPSKPSAWSCTVGELSASGRSRRGIMKDVERWTKARMERHDGMPASGCRNHAVLLSPTPSPSEFCPPHFRGVVESGPVELLNTKWDRIQAWLAACEAASPEEPETRPLRVVDKQQRICEVTQRRDESSSQSLIAGPERLDMGVSYLPAPSAMPQPRPSDCDCTIIGKLFPIDGLDGQQQALCERDYFARLNLVCVKYKKYHPEHFTCSICPTHFGPDDSYYEHDGDVYCHLHYSTQFAAKCAGCNSAILREFIYYEDELFHPTCYLLFKFWDAKLPKYEIKEREVTSESIKAAQAKTEALVRTIYTSMNTYEESTASYILNIVTSWRVRDRASITRASKGFVRHAEALSVVISEMEEQLGLEVNASWVEWARALCYNAAELFCLVSRAYNGSDAEWSRAQELATWLGFDLKNLVKVALARALSGDTGDTVEWFTRRLKALTEAGDLNEVGAAIESYEMVEKYRVEAKPRMANYGLLLNGELNQLSRALGQGMSGSYSSMAPKASGWSHVLMTDKAGQAREQMSPYDVESLLPRSARFESSSLMNVLRIFGVAACLTATMVLVHHLVVD
ncbi:hypothetical protein FRC07_000245 [Ceratobasidium sp. 392]|nr:hypothetical protein FRC07_000245 [Ceratobasidium sp. 392]